VARYPNGAPVRVSTTVRDLTGALVNPGGITLTVQKPDGTTLPYPAPVNDGTGLFHQDINALDLTANGHYQYSWVSTGVGAGVAVGTFDVFDPLEVTVLSLQDGKDMLNIPQATTTYDSELAAWIASIQSSLERYTGGPVINRQVTERAEVTAGYTAICLRQRPVVSVASITPDSGAALTITDLKIDGNAGVLRRAMGLPFYVVVTGGPPWVTVAYTAGWGTSVPPAFNSFARIVLDHMWATQRGPASLPMGSEETVAVPGFGFAIPHRAAELLNGSYQGIPFVSEAFL
jgi:hypothetical protein